MVIGYELRVGRLQGTLLRLSAFLLLASLLLKGSLAEADSSEAGELLGKGWQGAGRPKGGGETTEMSLGLWDSRVVWALLSTALSPAGIRALVASLLDCFL